MFRTRTLVSAVLLLLAAHIASGQENATTQEKSKAKPTPTRKQKKDTGAASSPKSVAEIAKKLKPSLALISVTGRNGKAHGVGTGFVISKDGLIATNLHVIGEARRFQVELGDGRKPKVVAIHASDRELDLAILQVEGNDFAPLALATSTGLGQGLPIVVMGNPHGLKESVVSGVVSGVRKVEGRDMIQVAVPVEPGNSGGPVVDRQGRVLGIMTMKSLVTNNLGFAVGIDLLKPLIARPNPVPIDKWQTIGTIDSRRWKSLFGGNWQQRGGRILVDGRGAGFAGRVLCLWQKQLPKVPYEVGVRVALDDEAGAAGLVFHSDGNNRHYGFYPSAGQLRLTRFEGPDVFAWKVLRNEGSPHYHQGKYNHIKVRVEKERFLCYVNDRLVFESTDSAFTKGRVGLAKFRETKATFKQFQVADKIAPTTISNDTRQAIEKLIDALPPLERTQSETIAPLLKTASPTRELLLQRAERLEKQANDLRRIAEDVHVQSLVREMNMLTKSKKQFDMLRACLLVAKLNEDDLDITAYTEIVDSMAVEVRSRLKKDADEKTRLQAIDKYLFSEQGFHGSRFDYYHRANSFMNRVLDDRVGLPITLSVMYMELAKRLDLKMEGVGLPGHFIVRFVPKKGDAELIDVFNEAKRMSRKQAAELVWRTSGQLLRDEHLGAMTSRDILQRVMRNLIGLAQEQTDRSELLRYLEMYLVLDPDSVSERGMRAMSRFETGRRQAAIRDLDWFLEKQPQGLDLRRIHQLRRYFETQDPPKAK